MTLYDIEGGGIAVAAKVRAGRDCSGGVLYVRVHGVGMVKEENWWVWTGVIY